jgi:UDP-glucose 4-epimerase
MLALKSNVAGEVFQVATGVETSIRQLASQVEAVVGGGLTISRGPGRLADIDKNYSSIQKAKQLLDWNPEVQLSEGLVRTWDWLKADATSTPANSSS